MTTAGCRSAARCRRTRKPLIGAINGVAVTGGFEVALNCDFLDRVGSGPLRRHARARRRHARVGSDRAARRSAIGVARAKQMSITGNYVDAATALAWGLVNQVVPHDELLPYCRQLAADAVSNDQRGVRRMLQTYNEVTRTTVDGAGRSRPASAAMGRRGLRPGRDRGPPPEDHRGRAQNSAERPAAGRQRSAAGSGWG